MTEYTVRAAIEGGPVALCTEHAQHLMALTVAEGGSGVRVEPGERFAISRGVAIVPVRGILTPNMFILERIFGWATYAGLAETMAELAANEEVNAIALVMDTPGGLVLGCEGAGQAIAAARAVKPVHVLVQHMALSAGYWLASQGTDISLTAGAWVGSIGVALMAVSYVQPSTTSGAQLFEMTSSHARAKRPDASTEAGRAVLQGELDAMETEFHATVAAGRGIPVEGLATQLSVTDDPADGGAVFWGQDALSRGLVDRLETDAAFWDRMAATYGPRPQRARGKSALVSAAAARARAAL